MFSKAAAFDRFAIRFRGAKGVNVPEGALLAPRADHPRNALQSELLAADLADELLH